MTMAIIQKRADELQPGDILLAGATCDRRIVLTGARSTVHPDMWAVRWYDTQLGAIETPVFRPEVLVPVEVPDQLVSAVDLANLVGAARMLIDLHDSGEAGNLLNIQQHESLTAIVERFRPPEPPTLAEALAQLQAVHDAKHPGDELVRVYQLLERARRAGVLK